MRNYLAYVKFMMENSLLLIYFSVREVNRQLIQVFQFVLSTGSAFVFGFWGVDWAAGPFDFGSRSLIGVFCALIVAIAEIYFLIKIIGVSDNFIDGVKNKKICSKDE